jgi:hypothetical protein
MHKTKPVLPVIFGDLMSVAGLADSAKELQTTLAAQLAAGSAQQAVEFSAVVFRQGPNRNFMRFYDADLPRFAATFVGSPFLGDHNQREVAGRFGTIVASSYDVGAQEMVQVLRITRPTALADFAAGLIDRFSIGWDYDDVIDSITGESWFDSPYWPGDKVKQADGAEQVCELFFVNPVGVETSAVNVPAVTGTRVLAQLAAAREAWQAHRPVVFGGVGVAVRASQPHALGDKPLSPPEAPAEAENQTVIRGGDVREMSHEQDAREGATALHDASTGGEEGTERTALIALRTGDDGAPAVLSPPVLMDGAAAKADAYLQVFAQQVLNSLLAESRLSEAGKAIVRAQLGKTPAVPEIEAAIAGQRELENSVRAQMQGEFDAQAAALSAQTQLAVQNAVKGMVPSDGGKLIKIEDEITRVQMALDWLIGAPQTAAPPLNMRSLRDLYLWMTEDYEWRAAATNWSVKRWEGAQLAAGSIANLPNMLVESLNRVMIDIFNDMAQYRWYEPLVNVVPHDGSTRTIEMITWNEVQDLPAVGEGDAYREAQLGDSKEQMMFQKRGMWIGLTLEMIRRNDLMRVREVPRKLMRAAMRTRSATVASIWTQSAGAGPTMSDGKALFHTDHGNLGTEAFSHAGWTVARQRAFKQTEVGSGKRIGYMPEFLLIPIDLLEPAMTVFGYGAGDVGKPTPAGTAQEVNIFALAENRPKIIPVPEWLDATDWAWLVNPRFVPAIQIGYANLMNGGQHPTPEIFTADSNTEGLMFSNDTLPIKIRDWYGVGVASYLGIGKQNVAG